MGYELHITRKTDWTDDGRDIALEEWLEVVRTDPEMRLDGYAEAQVDGRTLRYRSPGLAVWTAYSRQGNGNQAWFDYRDGNIDVKNPDREIFQKMWALAWRLKANIQDDDGWFFGAKAGDFLD